MCLAFDNRSARRLRYRAEEWKDARFWNDGVNAQMLMTPSLSLGVSTSMETVKRLYIVEKDSSSREFVFSFFFPSLFPSPFSFSLLYIEAVERENNILIREKHEIESFAGNFCIQIK